MTALSQIEIEPTKTHRDENFPVASVLIHPRHRDIILAFYRFVRTADDVADHPSLPEADKLAALEALEQGLLGHGDPSPQARTLRECLAQRHLPPDHARDLLTAFRMDVTKRRYQDWEDLLGYCRYSAMPVGRFVLDVHGEDRKTWPASDALCAALQVINHMQDCAADYRSLDRVYLPLDILGHHGAAVAALGEAQASPALRESLRELVQRTQTLLSQAEPFPSMVRDIRLGLEVAVIDALARRLTALLARRDPLSERVHLTAVGMAGVSVMATFLEAARRLPRWAAGTIRAGRP